MLLIINDSNNAYYNLAAEEYLIDNFDEDIVMLWRNDNTVVVGKNQNTIEEIDSRYVEEHGISVVRRLTGGGAVFHDLGNLNYTFIAPHTENSSIDFARFCNPVIDFLKSLGCDASLSGRNDIVVSEKKVSGSAQTVRNGKTMHHGTLLFSSDLSHIALSLNVNKDKLKAKGIKSVSSRVGNIIDFVDEKYSKMDVNEFKNLLADYITEHSELECTLDPFSKSEIEAISKLSDEKYSQWDWNFGKSKSFEKTVSKRFGYGIVEISYTLDGGKISAISINGDFFGKKEVSALAEMLIGARFEREELQLVLSAADVGEYISGAVFGDIVDLLLL
jgi:lipoate-protein ligase A